jgi:peptidoglycan/xylan/chitin deacetylase (PgdA/CDA1 family)
MVSFTFDDPAVSATTAGAEILRDAGLRGTFYIASGLLGGTGPFGPYASWADLERLNADGHELACHTHGHGDCARQTAQELEADVGRNAAAFADHGLPPAKTFAYPYGEVTRAAKAALAPRFGLLRAVHKGMLLAGADLNQAPAVPLEGEAAEASAGAWLEAALRRKAWLIFYTHDVVDRPSAWGCAPGALAAIARRARDSGAEVLTVREGLARLVRL